MGGESNGPGQVKHPETQILHTTSARDCRGRPPTYLNVVTVCFSTTFLCVHVWCVFCCFHVFMRGVLFLNFFSCVFMCHVWCVVFQIFHVCSCVVCCFSLIFLCVHVWCVVFLLFSRAFMCGVLFFKYTLVCSCVVCFSVVFTYVHVWRGFSNIFLCVHVWCVFLLFSRTFMCGVGFQIFSCVFMCHVWCVVFQIFHVCSCVVCVVH